MKLVFALLGVLLGISMCNYRDGWAMFFLLAIMFLGFITLVQEGEREDEQQNEAK